MARATGEGNNKERSYFTPRSMAVLLTVVAAAILVYLFVAARSVITVLLISIVFATGLAPTVERLEKVKIWRGRTIPRGPAIIIIYIIAFLVLIGAIAAIVVPTVQQSIEFSEDLPTYIEQLKSWLEKTHDRFPQVPEYAGVVDKLEKQVGRLGRIALDSAGKAFGFLGGVVSFFMVLVVTFFLLSGREGIKKEALSLVPPRKRKRAEQVLSEMSDGMGGWLRGQITLAIIIGLVISAAMLALGVPYALVIGVIGALAELLPMVGPVAAAVVAVPLAAFGHLWQLIGVIVFFIMLSIVEGNYLGPKIMQRHVGLSPLTTIIALLIGGALMGAVGALLAIPFAAAFKVLFQQVIAPAIRKAGEGGEE